MLYSVVGSSVKTCCLLVCADAIDIAVFQRDTAGTENGSLLRSVVQCIATLQISILALHDASRRHSTDPRGKALIVIECSHNCQVFGIAGRFGCPFVFDGADRYEDPSKLSTRRLIGKNCLPAC